MRGMSVTDFTTVGQIANLVTFFTFPITLFSLFSALAFPMSEAYFWSVADVSKKSVFECVGIVYGAHNFPLLSFLKEPI